MSCGERETTSCDGMGLLVMPSIKAKIEHGSSPLEIFHEFLMDGMFQYIADETNDYAENHSQHVRPEHGVDWFPTTADKIKVLLALLILMGTMKKPTLAAYWNRYPATPIPFFREMMPCDRFLALLRNLHVNSGENQDDRLHIIQPIVDELAETFRTVFVPTQDICTDESLWKFKGFKQYNPTKCARFGVKVYKVCQSTGRAYGYTCNYIIYTGQDRLNLPAPTLMSIDVMLSLNENLFDKGYNIYMDSWFSSPDFLQPQARTNVCGTVKTCRPIITA
ncbi:piggyBac transposable element-derived protein 4 [Octopus bimaculoides]|uniref:piggyBac transposable element-derived protein 4 n=1 Tax=Octopus bimaculoides TaxID=37653 RepID=UPI00071D7D1A|nr:piggyBac transposable element-derived protein 4 [Octopus bimaculoides]|eukprot:XP_014783424.1 PREDICTED: piggyBac transposable element-derived protein 4-like [Octopus bimaculoides]